MEMARRGADPETVATPEGIENHLDEITATEGYTIPMAIKDETVGLMKRVGIP
jgi:hypothetical protein